LVDDLGDIMKLKMLARIAVVLTLSWLLNGVNAGAAETKDACAPIKDLKFSTPPRFETESIVFRSGTVELEGCLYKPEGRARFPVMVEVAGSDQVPMAAHVYTVIHAKALAAKGVGMFAINRRGYGNSGGTANETDFSERADDIARAIVVMHKLPTVTDVGMLGFSQGGWVAPNALRPRDGVHGIILVSPSGVNPFEQIAYFIRGVAKALGLSEAEAAKAEEIHRAVFHYYASGRGYRAAQDLVSRYASEPWFEKFRTNEEWNERIGAGGKLLTPEELHAAWVKQADEFAIYRSPSTFANYTSSYRKLDRPTLIVEGSADTFVPPEASVQAIRSALQPSSRAQVEFKTFEGAEHGIQDGPRVRAAYLDFMSDWAAKVLKTE
jgi:pimeloyl-ACP methyl ester carboxylesterase